MTYLARTLVSFSKAFAIVAAILISLPLQAGDVLAESETFYYGEDLNSLRGAELKKALHKVLSAYHISRHDDFDEIVKFCHTDDNENCYTHKKLSYSEARKNVFGYLHLDGQKHSKYSVTSLYCLAKISNQDLPAKQPLGPMKIPSATVINTEHAWPQSKFTTKFPKLLQKGDLHILYPALMEVNSTRGNHPYGKVERVISQACEEAALGKDERGQTVFEPADDVKGDVARATFYFSTRYGLKIRKNQEEVLRQWHKNDPVDNFEKWRNHKVFQIQHIRNPFVDNPDWADKIEDF